MSFVAALIIGVGMTGCNGKTKALQSQLDSLNAADSIHQEDIKSMAEMVDMMSTGIDSINAQEGVLSATGKEGRMDKATLKAKLNDLANLVARQKANISKLEAELANNKSAYSTKMKKLIAFYKAQLDEKDKQIADLQQQIESKNANIEELNKNVATLTESNTSLQNTVTTQKSTIDEQTTTITQQDNTIHEAFVAIGTSSQLKSQGVIKGGFLAKKKVNVQDLNKSSFTKVDVRKYNDIKLNSSSPKIISQMPAASYVMTNNGDGTTTLHINNTNQFWSITKYLVVKL